MTKTRKATAAEVAEYRDKPYGHTTTLYPLAYWVLVIGVWCPVEGLYEHNGPKYEVIAPDGFHFLEGLDELHSLLCFDLADVRTRADYCTLAPCHADCPAL